MGEALYLVNTIGILILAVQDNSGATDAGLRDMGSYLTIASSFALPCLNIIFILYELIVLQILRKRRRGGKVMTENVVVYEEEEADQRRNELLSEEGRKLRNEGGDLTEELMRLK